MAKYSLVGIDGNAFAILGYVERSMRREKFTKEEIDKYLEDAKRGDYSNLACVSAEYIDKCNERSNNN